MIGWVIKYERWWYIICQIYQVWINFGLNEQYSVWNQLDGRSCTWNFWPVTSFWVQKVARLTFETAEQLSLVSTSILLNFIKTRIQFKWNAVIVLYIDIQQVTSYVTSNMVLVLPFFSQYNVNACHYRWNSI